MLATDAVASAGMRWPQRASFLLRRVLAPVTCFMLVWNVLRIGHDVDLAMPRPAREANESVNAKLDVMIVAGALSGQRMARMRTGLYSRSNRSPSPRNASIKRSRPSAAVGSDSNGSMALSIKE